jgi:hypothetical protein
MFSELAAYLDRLWVQYGNVESIQSHVLVLEGFFISIVDEGLNDLWARFVTFDLDI